MAEETSDTGVTFSFGRNWINYVQRVSDSDIAMAVQDITEWLGEDGVRDRRVVDVGCGSGINSLAFCRLGAKTVHAFDADLFSVEAAERLRSKEGWTNWTIEHGSVLHTRYLCGLGKFDVVYAWGVLHHTGAMWKAIDGCIGLVAPMGTLWLALYVKGPRYAKDLELKKKFNAASAMGKRVMIGRKILRKMASQLKHGKNPFAWNHTVKRGMNVYYDIVDWLGGLPYETATEDEVVRFVRQRGLVLERIKVTKEGDLNQYIFSKPA